MHAQIHPLGRLRQDITYSDFYEYMNCLEISPCTGYSGFAVTAYLHSKLARTAHQMSLVPVLYANKRFDWLCNQCDVLIGCRLQHLHIALS